jgi:WD40 repeat protein
LYIRCDISLCTQSLSIYSIANKNKIESEYQRWKDKKGDLLHGTTLKIASKHVHLFSPPLRKYIKKSLFKNFLKKTLLSTVMFFIFALFFWAYYEQNAKQSIILKKEIKNEILEAKIKIPNERPKITLANLHAYTAISIIYKLKRLNTSLPSKIYKKIAEARSILLNYPSHLLQTFQEQISSVYGLSSAIFFSNQSFAVGSKDKKLYIFEKHRNAHTYKKVKTYILKQGIRVLTFSKKHSTLFLGLENGTIAALRLNKNDHEIFTFKDEEISAVNTISTRNDTLYVGYQNGKIKKYQLHPKNNIVIEEKKSYDCNSSVNDIILKNDKVFLATRNGYIYVFDTDLMLLSTLKVFETQAYKLFSPKQKNVLYTISWGGELAKIGIREKTSHPIILLKRHIAQGRIYSICGTQNDRLLFLGLNDGTIKVIENNNFKEVANFYENDSRVLSLILNPDESQLISIDRSKTLRIYNIGNIHNMAKLAISNLSLTSLVLSSNQHYLITASKNGKIHIFNTKTFKHVCTWKAHSDNIYALAALSEGNNSFLIASGSWDKSLTLWKINPDNPYICAKKIERKENIHSDKIFDIHYNNGKLFSSGLDGTVKVWQISENSNEKIKKIKTYGPFIVNNKPLSIYKILLHPKNPNSFFIAFKNGKIGYITSKNSQQDKIFITKKNSHNAACTSLCITDDTSLLFSGSSDHSIKVWKIDEKNGRLSLFQTLHGHKDSIYTMLFDSKSKLLYSGSVDGTVHVWNIMDKNTSTFAILDRKQQGITKLAKSDNILFSAGMDGTIATWDINNIKLDENTTHNIINLLKNALKKVNFN